MSPATTIAPSAANISAVARPIPRAAPVTNATLSFNLIVFSLRQTWPRRQGQSGYSSRKLGLPLAEWTASAWLLRMRFNRAPPTDNRLRRPRSSLTACTLGYGGAAAHKHADRFQTHGKGRTEQRPHSRCMNRHRKSAPHTALLPGLQTKPTARLNRPPRGRDSLRDSLVRQPWIASGIATPIVRIEIDVQALYLEIADLKHVAPQSRMSDACTPLDAIGRHTVA